MKLPARLLAVCVALPALFACARSEITPDLDSPRLVAQSEQARQLARKEIPVAVLRQVDTDLSKTTFLFTDKAGTKEIDITAPAPDALPEQWTAVVISVSPLLGHSETDMNLQDLRAGPGRVARAVRAQWSGCKIRGFTLYRDESENDLVWVAFCDTPQGTVSGQMVNRKGVFQAFNVPPARAPVTATPPP